MSDSHPEGAEVWPLVIASRDWPPQVVADMRARDALGRERYGKPLRVFTERDALQDAYEEALDLLAYLTQHAERFGPACRPPAGAVWMVLDLRDALDARGMP